MIYRLSITAKMGRLSADRAHGTTVLHFVCIMYNVYADLIIKNK